LGDRQASHPDLAAQHPPALGGTATEEDTIVFNGDRKNKAEIKRLSGLLEEANKTIRTQERQLAKYSKLEAAAREVVKLATWSRGGYSLEHKPIEDLWAALEALQ
jgi:hypothetical protein